jgi:hypothetical protein
MRIGILADIHEEVRWLGLALERFRQERVDQVVVLGDVFCTGRDILPTVELLRLAHPVGVWGNHDFGLCFDPAPLVQERYAGPVLDFVATLRPRLEIDGCLFSHVEPWLDPTDLAQLWYFDGPPDTPAKAARSFDAQPHRVMFVGHFHRWLIARRTGCLGWDGSAPIRLDPWERYLVSIAAVCNGKCASFDTDANELVPHDLGASSGEEHGHGRTTAGPV